MKLADCFSVFVPNDDIAPVRRMRIRKAIAYGAVWAKTWTAEVTHIVVEGWINVQEASKAFEGRTIPVCAVDRVRTSLTVNRKDHFSCGIRGSPRV